jgi:hypothetical protein
LAILLQSAIVHWLVFSSLLHSCPIYSPRSSIYELLDEPNLAIMTSLQKLRDLAILTLCGLFVGYFFGILNEVRRFFGSFSINRRLELFSEASLSESLHHAFKPSNNLNFDPTRIHIRFLSV